MKAVILAGGMGTRISEESHLKPKPMVEIGGKPILWHIMKIFSHHGINEFVLCCGYKGYIIKEYFANYFLHMSDVTFEGDVGHVKEIVGEVFLDDVTLISAAEHKFVDPVVGKDLHDVPQNRLAADLNHRLWFEMGLFGYAGPHSTGKNNRLHLLRATLPEIKRRQNTFGSGS